MELIGGLYFSLVLTDDILSIQRRRGPPLVSGFNFGEVGLFLMGPLILAYTPKFLVLSIANKN